MKRNAVKYGALSIILISLLVVLTGCTNPLTGENGGEDSTAKLDGLPTYTYEEKEGYTEYTDSTEKVKFAYPNTWKEYGSASQVMFADQDMNSETAGSSVNLLSEKIPTGYTFDSYMTASLESLKATGKVSGEIKNEKINLNGTQAYLLTYEAKDSGITLKTTQVFISVDNTIYLLTAGCLDSSEEAGKPVIDQIVKSFRKV